MAPCFRGCSTFGPGNCDRLIRHLDSHEFFIPSFLRCKNTAELVGGMWQECVTWRQSTANRDQRLLRLSRASAQIEDFEVVSMISRYPDCCARCRRRGFVPIRSLTN